MLGINRVTRQKLMRIAGLQNGNGLVAGGLRARTIKRHEFVPNLAGILVDCGKKRGSFRKPQIGLIKRNLGGIDRL